MVQAAKKALPTTTTATTTNRNRTMEEKDRTMKTTMDDDVYPASPSSSPSQPTSKTSTFNDSFPLHLEDDEDLEEQEGTGVENGAIAANHAGAASSDQQHLEAAVAAANDVDSCQRCFQSTPPSPAAAAVTPHTSSKESNDFDVMVRKEQWLVRTVRIVFLLFLGATTTGVAFAVHRYVSMTEQDDFHMAFSKASTQVQDAVQQRFHWKLRVMDLYTSTLMSIAVHGAANQTWPFVVLSDFPLGASKVQASVKSLTVKHYHFVKDDHHRNEWERWTARNDEWVHETLAFQEEQRQVYGNDFDGGIIEMDHFQPDSTNIQSVDSKSSMIATKIHDDQGIPLPFNSGPYWTSWQSFPLDTTTMVAPYNTDVRSDPSLAMAIEKATSNRQAVVRNVVPVVNNEQPPAGILFPVLDHDDTTNETVVVAVVETTFSWTSILEGILTDQEGDRLIVVISNTCTSINQTMSYRLNGRRAFWLGLDDIHDATYDDMSESTVLSADIFDGHNNMNNVTLAANDVCSFTVTTYASKDMEMAYTTNDPVYFTVIFVAIMVVTTLFFFGYDFLVARRQSKTLHEAAKSNRIVASLFPSNVRRRLLNQEAATSSPSHSPSKDNSTKRHLDDNGKNDIVNERPIADLFANCTVMFADIANFTAWSSTREPGHVFMLLESVYGALDRIAEKRGVFKVETIGDSYVAVTGLPEPNVDHAIVMCKFARDARECFADVSRRLERSLGPETGDLSLRIGLHSGPVTAGVLRGQKSRFQLFGDTVNTAARMESTGTSNRIHVSQATADLLIKANKKHWVTERFDKVNAKGKGLMQTFWVDPPYGSDLPSWAQNDAPSLDNKTERLVSWIVDVLQQHLQKIVARRNALMRNPDWVEWDKPPEGMVIDEVAEVIHLAPYDGALLDVEDFRKITLPPRVLHQLRDYVETVARTYHHGNAFHNFEHASHVVMSVAKLMNRIVTPTDRDASIPVSPKERHDRTYGISSDPLLPFACVFAALIHDVDHSGVPNATLVSEHAEVAHVYQGKSVAEQNSVNLAWSQLMESRYMDLRDAICERQEESDRFRQLVVNSVMATDIMDKDLQHLRDQRWSKAFARTMEEGGDYGMIIEESDETKVNRKATIVIEHLIQASDVAHTMQHWHIYQKWNERLFMEMSKAYNDGRSESNPADFWYEGELGFFDFYVIPLAKKLADCGVFGVSSGEYLNYAIQNRSEWENKGKDVVDGYLKKMMG